jgi:HK97 family phage portal protein
MPAPALISRVAASLFPAAYQKAVGGWLWPSQANPAWWGNGDRGPLGSWQMNRNGPQGHLELVAFSAVYACVNTIASDVAKLPIEIYKVDQKTGARTLQRADYYAALFREPNQYQTHADLLYAFAQSYLLQGNAYCYMGKRNGRGETIELHVLNPYRVKPMIAFDGSVFYECGEDFLAGITPNTVVPERDMIHHRLPLLPGYPLVGVTPIFAAAASSAVGIKILQDSQQFFANSARPSGLLQSTINLGDEQKRKAKEEWDIAYRGREYGKVAILPNGLDWKPITITAQDAQLIEQLRWSVEDVARVFRVPTFMLGDVSKVTYRNSEQLARAYLTGCLASHIEALEERFERAFQFPLDYEIKFDLTQLLRTEIDIRYAAYQQSLNAGWQSINEVRAQEGLEPVVGGEVPRVQMQYVPIDAVPDAASTVGPGPGEPGDAPGEPAPAPTPPEQPPSPATTESAPDTARVRALVRQRLTRRAA